MAFVSVSNSAGMLHHGGQMSWDAISATRAVMVTVTGDFKALVQEINFANGVTTLGTPSFVKQIVGAAATNCMRPRVKSLGNNRILVLVPAVWVLYDVSYGGWGNTGTNAIAGANRPNIKIPSVYDCLVMERDVSGNYKVLSSLQVPFTLPMGNDASVAEHAFAFLSVSDTQIVIQKASAYLAGSNAGVKPWLKITLNMVNGILTDYTAVNGGYGAGTKQWLAFDIRHKKTADGTPVMVYTVADRTVVFRTASTQRRINYNQFDAGDPSVLQYASVAQHDYMCPQAFVPIDGVSKFLCLSGDATGNTNINGNNQANGQPFFFPLDAQWIAPTVVGIVGTPNDTSFLGPIFDIDAAISIGAQNNGVAKQLYFSAREVGGSGTYVGPFDPIALPYFAMSYMNKGNMIHRIDDKNCWIIGCFMADANATPKIGVITVSV